MTDIPGHRLASQRLLGNPAGSAKALIRHLGAVQAQDYAMSRWALGVRLSGATDASIEKALDKGDIIRTHVLRPTWHLVPAEDLGWMLDLSARQIAKHMKSSDAKLGLDAKVIAKSNDEIGKWIQGRQNVTREEMMAHVQGRGIATGGMRGLHLTLHAEINKIICSGKRRGNAHTYTGYSDRIKTSVFYAEDQALAKLAKRYFRSHGPATLRDFTWWSGLPVGKAKEALASVAGNLRKTEIGGVDHYYKSSGIPRAETVGLLPAFDEYLIGYADRSAVISDHHASHAYTSNGIFRPLIVVGGQVCGIWKRSVKGETVIIEPKLFNRLTLDQRELLERQAVRYAGFLGKTLQLEM